MKHTTMLMLLQISLAVNGTNNAISTYVSADDSWSYMQTGDAAANFNAGQGYSIRREMDQSAGNISFTGDFKYRKCRDLFSCSWV